MLTDLRGMLPGLNANIVLNKALMKASGVSVRCGTLEWSWHDIVDSFGQHTGQRR